MANRLKESADLQILRLSDNQIDQGMWRGVKDRDLLIFHHLRHYKSQIRMHLLTQTHEVNTENDGKCAMRTRFVSLFARSFDVSTGIEHVGQLLVRLKELDLSYNLMSAEGASALVPFLSGTLPVSLPPPLHTHTTHPHPHTYSVILRNTRSPFTLACIFMDVCAHSCALGSEAAC